MKYTYALKTDFSVMIQPTEGMLERDGGRIVYDRRLPEDKLEEYGLEYLGIDCPEQCLDCRLLAKCAELDCLKDKPCASYQGVSYKPSDEIRY